MRAQLDQRVFVSVVRQSSATEVEEHVRCSAHQIGGVLLQPVPISEMERICGVNTRGSRILVDWPIDLGKSPVQPGDHLMVAGHSYPVLAVQEDAGGAVDLYVLEA